MALVYFKPDPKVMAERIADVARRCWLPKEAAFAGFRFDRIEPGAEPNIYRVIFADRPRGKTSPRHLRVLVGWLGSSATIMVTEQEGVDVSEPVGRVAENILEGRSITC